MNKSEHLSAPIHEDGVDCISNLPDHVLPLILSRLPSTKESIRTSILSRRWRYMWTSAPSLDLVCRGGWNHSEKNKFKSIVNRALLHRSINLDSLRLLCCNYFSTSTVERWIHLTVMRNVKKLDLTFWSKEESEDQVLPNCLVTCASLEVLRLQCERLIVPSFSGFPALRVLNLNVELFDDDLVKHFLESFPLLEDLTFDGCRLENLDLLCISCPKLKVLRFFNVYNDELCGSLKLSCPKLVFLQLRCQVASNYISEGLYSLKEAVIDPDYEDISELFHTMSGLFHIISHVESLTTNLYFLYECIDVAPDLVLPNLKTLKLYTRNTGYTVKGLNQTLRMCPKLESLCLNFEEVYTYKDYSEDYDETEYPKLDGVGTSNLTPDLKWVEFFEFNGEKPKLTIHWYDKNKTEWKYVVAKWDKNLFRLAKWDRNRKQNNQVAQNNNAGPQQPPPGEVMMASLYQLIQDGQQPHAYYWNRLGAILDYQHDRMLHLENLIYHLKYLIYQSRCGGILPPKIPNYPYWRDGANNNGNGNGQDGSGYQGGDGGAYNWNRYGAMLAYNHDCMVHFENVIYEFCRGGILPPQFPNFLYWRDGDNKNGSGNREGGSDN